MSADDIRACGTSDAKKTRSPKGVNVYTSNQRSRRLWDRTAGEQYCINTAVPNMSIFTLHDHDVTLNNCNSEGATMHGAGSKMRVGLSWQLVIQGATTSKPGDAIITHTVKQTSTA